MAAALALSMSAVGPAAGQPERSPDSLAEAYETLSALLPEAEREAIKVGSEQNFVEDYIFTGLWIRSVWLKYGKGNLLQVLQGLGLKHHEDMADIVLQSYWCHLNRREINWAPLTAHFEQYWQEPRVDREGTAVWPVKVCPQN